MITVGNICQLMESRAPLSLAEDWDNVGLLVGDRTRKVKRVMTCLTVTPASCQEAIREKADLIIAHHPLPFRPLTKVTTDTIAGRMLLDLIRADVAIYSAHTAFDSAAAGINRQIAEGIGLNNIVPIIPPEDANELTGTGRVGELSSQMTGKDFCDLVKSFFGLPQLRIVGDLSAGISKVAIACGSAGQFLDNAIRHQCDAFITGETSFHSCLDAEARGVLLVLPGHFATERFAMQTLAESLTQSMDKESAGVRVWVSAEESDPIRSV